jgi:hypothetical protein
MSVGKFNSKIDELIWSLSLDGGPDEECGDSGTTGWYGLMAEINERELRRAAADMKEDFEQIAKDESDSLDRVLNAAGVILAEDGQGFVSIMLFETPEKLDDAWDSILADCESGDEEESEEDDAEESEEGDTEDMAEKP